MSLTQCPFCEHGNPADSKFCSECGGALHLVPCPRCGAVSQITATVCYQCGGQLRGGGTDALTPSSPVAEVSTPLAWRPSRVIVGTAGVIVGTAVLAAIAVLGYYTFRQRSYADAPQPPAASSDSSGPGAPATAGFLDGDAAAGATKSTSAEDDAGLTGPATSPSGTPPAAPALHDIAEHHA